MTGRAAIMVCTLLVLGCGADDGTDGRSSATGGDSRMYVVRGVVTRLEPKTSPPQVWLRHEAIPGFVGPDGRESGMDPMEMPFPLAPGVEIGSLARGDEVQAVLEIDWRADLPAKLTRLETLPPGTELNFDPLPEEKLEPSGEPPDN